MGHALVHRFNAHHPQLRKKTAGKTAAFPVPLPLLTLHPTTMQQTFWRLMRLAHWVIGAFILTTLTFFAVTGFMLNHTAWFEQEPTQHDAEYTLPTELPLPELSDDPNAPTPALAPALTAWLAEHSPYPISAYQLKIEAPEILLEYQGPGSEASLTIDSESRAVAYHEQKNGLAALLNNLHKGCHTPAFWKRYMDAFAILTVLVALSGLALLVYYRKQRGSTWLWTTTGITIPLIIILLAIHY